MACGTNDLVLLPFFKELKSSGLIDYLELHIKSNATIKQLRDWQNTGLVKYIHSENGGRAEFVKEYLDMAIDVWTLSPYKGIIFDIGISGEAYDLTSDELNWGKCLLPENMPYKTSFGDICVGYMPSEMPKTFTFDVSHAWITANQLHLDPKQLVLDFLKLKPSHIHLTDCYGTNDHLVMGTGEIDWQFVLDNLPKKITVTIETDNVREYRRENIKKDLLFFKALYDSKDR